MERPDVTINRYLALEKDPTGDKSIVGQCFKELDRQSHRQRHLGAGQWWTTKLVGEDCQDAGGGFRDVVQNLGVELMSEALPLFVKTGDKLGESECYVPNPGCLDLEKFRFVGNLMGACIRSEERLTLDLPRCVWELLAGRGISFQDYAMLEPEVAESMRQIEENDFPSGPIPEAAWPETLCLTFTVTGPKEEEIELVPAGAARAVHYSDRFEYVRLLRHQKLHQWDTQIAAMRQGLRDYRIYAPVFALWRAADLEVAVAGDPVIPVEQLQKSVQVDGPHDQKTYFWAAVERMTMDQRSLMIKFACGRSRLPVNMYVKLGRGSSNRLATSSVCGFTMYIPAQSTAEDMYQNLVETVVSCQDFGTG